jgi:hypothetical protein
MKKSDKKFKWTEETDAAFAHLKKLLSTPLVLVAPKVMWVCPSGTHGLVYRVRPIIEVDKYKDSTR